MVDLVARLKVFKPVTGGQVQNRNQQQTQQQAASAINKEAILLAKFVDDQRIVGATKDNFVQHFVWLSRAHDLNPSTPFSLGGDRKQRFTCIHSENGIDQIDRSIKKFDMPILLMNQGHYVVKGGYWDGRIAFCPVENTGEGKFELKAHQTSVSALACTMKESVMITGSKSGEVIIWKNADFESSTE